MKHISEDTLIKFSHAITLFQHGQWIAEDWSGVYCELANRAACHAKTWNRSRREADKTLWFALTRSKEAMEFSQYFTITKNTPGTEIVVSGKTGPSCLIRFHRGMWSYTEMR